MPEIARTLIAPPPCQHRWGVKPVQTQERGPRISASGNFQQSYQNTWCQLKRHKKNFSVLHGEKLRTGNIKHHLPGKNVKSLYSVQWCLLQQKSTISFTVGCEARYTILGKRSGSGSWGQNQIAKKLLTARKLIFKAVQLKCIKILNEINQFVSYNRYEGGPNSDDDNWKGIKVKRLGEKEQEDGAKVRKREERDEEK